MPLSVDDKAVLKAYLSRKVRTVPILILMLFSLFPLSMFTFRWIGSQLAWHKTEAEIVMVNEDGDGFYRYTSSRTKETFSGIYTPTKILMHFRIGNAVQPGDRIPMAYNPEKPSERVLFPDLEQKMLTWMIVFLVCFVTYFWLEWVLKKRSKIRIPG